MYTDVIYMMQTNFTSKTAEFLRSFEQATQTPCRTGSEGPTQRELDDFRDRYPIDSRAYGVGYQELILSWIYVRGCEDCELGCCDLNIFIDLRELRFIIVR